MQQSQSANTVKVESAEESLVALVRALSAHQATVDAISIIDETTWMQYQNDLSLSIAPRRRGDRLEDEETRNNNNSLLMEKGYEVLQAFFCVGVGSYVPWI